MLRVTATLLLLAMALPLAGCVVYPAHPNNWCYYHPYKCGYYR